MSLADTPPEIKKRNHCGVYKLGLTNEDTEALNGWLGNYSDAAIAERLRDYTGKDIGGQTIARHRQQRCSCYR